MKRLSSLAFFVVTAFILCAASPAAKSQTTELDYGFISVSGTIFEIDATTGKFDIPLDQLALDLENATDTSPPDGQMFPVGSPCLNRIANSLEDWVDLVSSDPLIYVPGDTFADPVQPAITLTFDEWLDLYSDRLQYQRNFFLLLQWSVEQSRDHHDDCFSGGGDGGGGGGSGGDPPSEGSGTLGDEGWTVIDPDPATANDEWDIDELPNPFTEDPSDCDEVGRWLLNMTVKHFPDGGTSDDALRELVPSTFDELCPCEFSTQNGFEGCPDYFETWAELDCENLPSGPANDGEHACPSGLFGDPALGDDCFGWMAQDAYTEIIKNYNFELCSAECSDEDNKNQRIRDVIAMEMAARFQLIPTCGDRDCETAMKFREVYDAAGATMTAMDFDFLYGLGGCSTCYDMPASIAHGMLDPTEPGGAKGTDDGTFRCDWDFDGEQTPMDAVLFARATMRGDVAASAGMAFPSPTPADCGSYGSTFLSYSRHDWADQFLINTEQIGTSCDLLTCEGRAAFVDAASELLERHWEEMGVPPAYHPSPPTIEDMSRPRESGSSGGVAFPDDTGTGQSPCKDYIVGQPMMMSAVNAPPADEASGDDEDLDETVAETCPPSEEPASTSTASSPHVRMREADNSDNPIRLTTGEKVESAVDLVIPLTGKDFRLVRNYRSLGTLDDGSLSTPYDGVTGGNLVGNFWTMPLTKWIDESGLAAQDPYVVFHSSEGPKHIKLHTESGGIWGQWRGQRTQRFVSEYSPVLGLDGVVLPSVELPVWRLIQPGAYTLEFWRNDTGSATIWAPEDAQVGRLLRRIDAAGNIWQFVYKEYHDGSTTPQIMDSRPIGIRFLRAPEPGTTDYIPMAELQLVWDERAELDIPGTGIVNNINYARLREARVVRYLDESTSIVTQRVLYTYFNSYFAGSGQPYNSDLGSNGDLIQVTKLTRVDGDSPEAEVWRTQITQYRYHSGNYSTSQSLDLSTPDPWDLVGHKHALKAVFYPEQIERYAFSRSGVSDMDYIADAAKFLLQADDLDGSDDPLALNWAGKVITKYEPAFDGTAPDFTQPFRVREQMMVADCGCSGGSAIQTRYTYDYFDLRHIPDPNPIADDLVWTVHTTEWNHDDSGWIAQTKMMYDYVQQSPTQQRLRLQHQVLAAPINASTGATDVPTQYWVTRYEYDRRTPQYGTLTLPRDVLKAILYPLAAASYSPASSGAMAVYTADTNQGLVLAFNHNEDGRLTEERVRKGWSPIRDDNSANYESDLGAYTLLRWIQRPTVDLTYLQGFGNSIVQALPVSETSYSGTGASGPVTTSYRYALEDSMDFSVGQRIVGIATVQNPVALSENGSGGNGIADATRSIVIFDESGEVQFAIDANDSLTVYSRQHSTGRVSSILANANPASHSLPTLVFSNGDPDYASFAGRHSDGGSLTTEITRDALGRITTVTAPGGVKSSIVRSIQPWAFTEPESTSPHPYSYYTETVLPHYYDEGGTIQFTGTSSRTWFNAGGIALGAESYELDPVSASDDSLQIYGHDEFRYEFEFANAGAPVTRSVTGLSAFGLVELTAVWPDLSAFGGHLHELITEPDAIRPRVSTFTYDYRGNLIETQSPDGSIQAVEYDILDRPIAISLGTDSSPGSGNMVTVRQMWYDFDGTSSGVGDGHLTLVRESPTSNSSDDRDTEMRYDYRGRLITVINPESPHAHFEYDNLDRTTTALLFDETSGIPSDLDAPASLARLSKIDFHYDSQGRPFRRSVAIDPTSGSSGTLDEFMWYDLAGQAIAAQTPSSPKVKMQYDGLGRLIRSYVTADTGEINPTVSGSFADTYDAANYAPNLSGDVVYEQTEYNYIKTGTTGLGRLDLVTNRSRIHDTPDTATGELDASGFDSLNTYTGFYYDAANRLVHTVEFGTNDTTGTNGRFIANTSEPNIDQSDAASLFDTVPSSLPTDLQQALITSRRFDNRGRLSETLSPWRTESTAGTRTRSLVFYNDLNEMVGSIENAKPNGSGEDPAIDWDNTQEIYGPVATLGEYTAERSRAMSFNRNTIGQVTRRMAWDEGLNAQTTQYEYEHNITGGALTTNLAVNWLVRRINYPDESSGDPDPSDHTLSEEFAYNRLGELIATVDQNSTQHTYTRDALGRVTRDDATILSGSGIHGGIVAIEYEFDTAGRLHKKQSISNTASISNAMRYTYDSLWRLTQIEQNPLGDLGANPTTGIVNIDYEDVAFNSGSAFGTHNISRATDLKYPLGAQGASSARTVLSNTYGPSGALNDIISRATGFEWNRGSSTQVQSVSVQRLGLAAPVHIEYPVPDLALDRVQDNSSTFGLDYKGLDRFGRITNQMWIKPGRDPSTGQTAVSVGYEYNRIGNITARTDERLSAAAQFRDETYEFDELDRLTGMERTPGTNPFELDWTLDTFGNWSDLSTAVGGSTVAETRDHNQANELTERTINGGSPLDLTFDHAGNMVEQDLSSTSRRFFIYDAWNRLVGVQYQTGTSTPQNRALYSYYPGGERAASLIDTDQDRYFYPNDLNLFYYDASWRLLEIRTDSDTLRPTWKTSNFALSSTRQFIWGEQYIDELVAYMRDTAASLNTNGTLATDPTYATLDYALTDRNFSVIGTGFTSAAVGDRVRYDPYGTFQVTPAGDVNGDGTVHGPDIYAVLFPAGYQADLDLNMNGATDMGDETIAYANLGRSFAPNELSDRGNIVGWCGYLYEESTGMWLARHRWQIPELGRWANRDPISYAGGGQNLYEYVNGNPVFLQDPTGLKSNKRKKLTSKQIAEKGQGGACEAIDKYLARGPNCGESESEWDERRARLLHSRGSEVNNCGGAAPGTDYSAAYWKGFGEGAARGAVVTGGAIAGGALILASPVTGGTSGVAGAALIGIAVGVGSGVGGAAAGELFDVVYYGEEFETKELIVGGAVGGVTGGVLGGGGHGLRSAWNSQSAAGFRSNILGWFSGSRSSGRVPLRFSQTTASRTFQDGGPFGGQSVSSVAARLRSGDLSISQFPVEYVERNGVRLIVNTRSSLALRQAGIPEEQWVLVNRTGNGTIETDMTARLARNGLTDIGTEALRVTGRGKGASCVCPD